MSYRGNGTSGYYARDSVTSSGQNHRYNAMRSGIHNGEMRHVGGQNRNTQLFMGDLDPSWDETTIREIWKDLGESNVEIKMMWNNRNGLRAHMGFCFVQFPSQGHASNAILKNGVQIPNHPYKTLKLNWSSSSSHNNNNQEAGEISIFVGDLAPNVTESDLFEAFIARYPSTFHVKVVFDQVTGVSKGYAFVKFGNREDQQRALKEMTGTFLKGRAIRVGNAGHQNQRNRGGPAMDDRTRKLGGTVPNSKSSKISVISTSQFMFPTQQIPPLNCFTDPNNTSVFVKGLSASVTDKEFKAILQPFGQIVYAQVLTDKHCGVAQYVDREAAEAAIRKLQGYRLRSSRLILSWGKPLRMIEDAAAQYQSQPSLKHPTYGHMLFSYDGTTSGGETADFDVNDNENMLLPGYSIFQGIQLPLSASEKQQVFEWKPNKIVDMEPHVLIQKSDTFVQAAQSSMDRIEEASSGHIFA